MEIAFRTSKLQKRCNQHQDACRAWGQENAEKLGRRLQEIYAADNLEQFCRLPAAGGHQLDQDLRGKWACSLAGRFRLVFEPDGDPTSFFSGGRVVAAKVVRVKILEVTNHYE